MGLRIHFQQKRCTILFAQFYFVNICKNLRSVPSMSLWKLSTGFNLKTSSGPNIENK
jgi:hypothetical protein